MQAERIWLVGASAAGRGRAEFVESVARLPSLRRGCREIVGLEDCAGERGRATCCTNASPRRARGDRLAERCATSGAPTDELNAFSSIRAATKCSSRASLYTLAS